MPSSRNRPLSEQEVLDSMFNNFYHLQNAQYEFRKLWYDTGQGERLPDDQQVKDLLRSICDHAELLDLGYTSLRALRQSPDLRQYPD